MTGTGARQKEACSPIELLASPKSIMIGMWNVQMMYRIILALYPLRVMIICFKVTMHFDESKDTHQENISLTMNKS